MDYEAFLDNKSQLGSMSGFDPLWVPDFLYDFQKMLVEWSVRKGRAAQERRNALEQPGALRLRIELRRLLQVWQAPLEFRQHRRDVRGSRAEGLAQHVIRLLFDKGAQLRV